MTAKSRASVTLSATTGLEPAAALDVIKRAANKVKGGGKSLLTTGLMNLGAEVHVEESHDGWLGLSITSGKRLIELCTFRARASSSDGAKTRLTVGGLDRYKTSQSAFLGLIPTGPKKIPGYDPYRRFLDQVAADLRAADNAATISIDQAH